MDAGSSALVMAVVIGVPVVIVGMFGLNWWDRVRDRRAARAAARRRSRRMTARR
jgi:hypothetical protein